MRKVIYSGMYGGDAYPFNDLAWQSHRAAKPEDLIELDSVLVLWGGADINPSLYGHEMCKETYCYPDRDNLEWELAHEAVRLGIPIIGVCRGAQLLCALAGGYLIQHTTMHAGYGHTIDTYDGQRMAVNSIHHQMMYVPEKVDHRVLAWSTDKRSTTYKYDGDKDHPVPDKELEFVHFPKIKGWAVQWHPEGMSKCKATEFILKEFNHE